MRIICCLITVLLVCSSVQAEAILAQYGDHFYAVVQEELSWSEAEALCRKHGGYLVCINDEHENNFVRQTYQAAGVQFGWIGLSSDDNGGQAWVNGEPMTYRNFAPGDDRDNRSNFNINVRNGEWVGSNRLFGAKRAFMCESPRPLPRHGWVEDDDPRPRPRPEVRVPDVEPPSSSSTPEQVPGFKNVEEIKPKPKVDVEALKKKVEGSRVSVKVEQRRLGITLSSPGVMVGDRGLIVIPSGVLAHATEATLNVDDEELEMEPVSVDAYSGLALMRVKTGDDAEIKLPQGLELGHAEPGQDVFIIELIHGKPDLRSATVGRVFEQRQESSKRQVMRFSNGGRFTWDQAGAPIVDSQGKLIGMTVYSKKSNHHPPSSHSPAGAQAFEAVALNPSSVLMANPDASLSFQQADRTARETATPYMSNVIAIKPRGSARAVRLVALRVEKRLVCQRCDGDGQVVREVKVGEEIRHGMKRDIYEKQEFECQACGGSGLVSDEQIHRTVIDLAKNLGRMNPEDPDAEKAYEAIEDSFKPMYDRHRWRYFQAKMEHLSTELLEKSTMRPGEPVAMVGRNKPASVLDLNEDDYVVLEAGMDRRLVILEKPLVRSFEVRGEDITAGGIVIGSLVTSDGERIPILGHGFATNHPIRR